jgi:NAD(P)-dependent dehydrogenase (short-subunit alcohol dehydrogenase family)
VITSEYRIDGEVCIVTGAGRGIGKAIALALAQAGADVILAARSRDQIEQTADEIRKMGRKALAIPTDVAKEDQIAKLVDRAISAFEKIDVLCNCAGTLLLRPVAILPGVKLPGWEAAGDELDKPQTLEEWNRVMDTNLTSAFLFAKELGPHMIRRRKGKVVNISSIGANQGLAYNSSYNVSKAGLSVFTRCLASEWAPFGINVNAIAPGLTNTIMIKPLVADPKTKQAKLKDIPLGRLGEPREVALLAVFLASSASNYITGQVIAIDGGVMGRGPDI